MTLFGKHILIVDDEPDIRQLLGEDFSEAGCTIRQAENGAEALRCLDNESFDVIISDIQMPQMSGVDFIKEVKRNDASDPLIFLISATPDISEDEAYELGISGLFPKPFDSFNIIQASKRDLQPGRKRWHIPTRLRSNFKARLFDKVTGESYEGLVSNISRGGFHVVLDREIPEVDNSILFSISLIQNLHVPIVGEGIVRWRKDNGHLTIPLPKKNGCGIQFTALQKQSEETLEEVISDLSRQK